MGRHKNPPLLGPIAATANRVQVGDVVTRRPITFTDTAKDSSEGPRLLHGTVVYVHPRGRFHVVEFGEGCKAVRESFAGVQNG